MIVLIAGLAGAPAASAQSPATMSTQSLAGLYPPAASVHPEPGVAPPRLSGDMWILAEGTHFLYDDFVQIGGSRLIFQRDDNLVLYVSRGRPFASRTCCHPDLELAVHSAHHLSIYSTTTGFALWNT